jgi:hypothetical protein
MLLGKSQKKIKLSDPILPKAKAPKLYCTCKRPYEQDAQMIKCDCCPEWFHFDCLEKLGKALPVDDQGQLPRNFRWICESCQLNGKRPPPRTQSKSKRRR